MSQEMQELRDKIKSKMAQALAEIRDMQNIEDILKQAEVGSSVLLSQHYYNETLHHVLL